MYDIDDGQLKGERIKAVLLNTKNNPNRWHKVSSIGIGPDKTQIKTRCGKIPLSPEYVDCVAFEWPLRPNENHDVVCDTDSDKPSFPRLCSACISRESSDKHQS